MPAIEESVREATKALVRSSDEHAVMAGVRRARSRRSAARRLRIAGVVATAVAVSVLGISIAGRAFRPNTEAPPSERLTGNGLIAFTSFFPRTEGRDVREPLYLFDPDSRTLREVMRGPVYAPAWSPDGNLLAYAALDRSAEFPHQLVVSRLDGSDRRVLLARDGQAPIYDVAWAPDGRQIAVVLTEPPPEVDRFSEADLIIRLYVINADGSGLRALTPEDTQVTSFDWSPDGQRIVFTERSLREGEQRFESDLFVMNRDGSGLRPLTRDHRSLHPAWSPDGASIAFLRYEGDDFESRDVWVMPSVGGAPRRLTSTRHTEDTPAWSPDATKLVFGRFTRGTGCSLVVVDFDSGAEESLLSRGDIGGCFQAPTWQPVSATTPEP